MDEKNINAIIKLLDDPDTTVYQHIEIKLFEMGASVVKYLENAWTKNSDPFFQKRVEYIIHKIQFKETLSLLKQWLDEKSDDVLKGAYIVAKAQYPALDYEIIFQKIEKIKRTIWLELRENFTPLQQIRILNQVLFQMNKYTGNNVDFYDPKNCYINEVIDTAKGNPITLSIIYIAISKRLGLPIYGINLPKNFILAYVDMNYSFENIEEIDEINDIFFYINPHNKGAVLGRKEIDFFLKQQKITPMRDFYVPCSNEIIIQRLIANLIFCYKKVGNSNKVEDFQELMNLFAKKLDDNLES